MPFMGCARIETTRWRARPCGSLSSIARSIIFSSTFRAARITFQNAFTRTTCRACNPKSGRFGRTPLRFVEVKCGWISGSRARRLAMRAVPGRSSLFTRSGAAQVFRSASGLEGDRRASCRQEFSVLRLSACARFCQSRGELAEEQGHHPDLTLSLGEGRRRHLHP